jgi:hypothetical protein
MKPYWGFFPLPPRQEHGGEFANFIVTSPLLISTIQRSPQHPLSLLPACCVFNSRSPATTSKSGVYSAFCAQVLLSQPPVKNYCQLPILNWTLSLIYQLIHFASLNWIKLSRAEQSSSLLLATSQHGHSWHRAPLGPMAIYIFCSMSRLLFFVFPFFRCSSFDKKGGVRLFL